MTQILTCLTDDHVVVVADRRLSVPQPDGTTRPCDDEACKLVLIASEAVVGYTGLAGLPQPPDGNTDLWLLNALAPYGATINELAVRLEKRATEAFENLTGVRASQRHHAFTIAGWFDDGRHGLRPFYATVSNALGPGGAWSTTARDAFTTRIEWLPRQSAFRLEATGQPLADSIRRDLLAKLADPAAREPHRMAALLAQAVRDTAAAVNTVGEALLVSILPRETAGETRRGVVMGTGVEIDASGSMRFPETSGAVNFYLPASTNTGVTYTPHCLDRGMSIADVRVHDRVLSDEEIRQRYEEGLKKFKAAGLE